MQKIKLKLECTTLSTLKRAGLLFIILLMSVHLPSAAEELDIDRGTGKSSVESRWGQPLRITGPVGTFAEYTLWHYSDFTVAFADNRVIHAFSKSSESDDIESEDAEISLD